MYAIIGKFQLRRYYFCAENNLVVLSIDLYFEPSQCSTLKLISINQANGVHKENRTFCFFSHH
jgi:hypothetical protein